MPVIIEDVSNVNQLKQVAYTPKFFHNELTGTGRAISGVLNRKVSPKDRPCIFEISKNDAFHACHVAGVKTGQREKTLTLNLRRLQLRPIPLAAVAAGVGSINKPYGPHVTEIGSVNGRAKAYIYSRLDYVVIKKVRDHSDDPWDSNHDYVFTNYLLIDPTNADDPSQLSFKLRPYPTQYGATGPNGPVAFLLRTDTFDDHLYQKVCDKLASGFHSRTLVPDADQIIASHLDNYSVYEDVTDAAHKMAEDCGQEVAEALTELATHNYSIKSNNIVPSYRANEASAIIMTLLDSYNVDLSQYSIINQAIEDVRAQMGDDSVLSMAYEASPTLSMISIMEKMHASKSTLPVIPNPQPVAPTKIPYTNQQRQAIETTSPLALVTAGAGTGKSSVVIGRIDHMVNCGVDPASIMVLSFTNAAADNITERNPKLVSMTISKFIHDVYTFNHPLQELSMADTLANMLEVSIPVSPIASALIDSLRMVNRDQRHMNAIQELLRMHYSTVMGYLDQVGQTCLEMQILAMIADIDNIMLPDQFKNVRHIIIDEVQDNSVWDFTFSMLYANKMNVSLYMVGDASQTLYEFRSSNPKVISAIETSGAFDTFKLETNFRSNQAVLDYANVVLDDIDTNRHARVQLLANQLETISADTFCDRVVLSDKQITRMKDVEDNLPDWIIEARSFIADALKRGEKVCALAYSRLHVNMIRERLEEMFPNENVVSLVPARNVSVPLFSKFLLNEGRDFMMLTPLQHLLPTVISTIESKAQHYGFSDSQSRNLPYMLGEFQKQYWDVYMDHCRKVVAKTMTKDDLVDKMIEAMVAFEIRTNAVRASLLARRNSDRKADNAEDGRLIVSTIHSAKGLEFDNTVVFIKEPKGVISQSDRRMHYVALTRAKHRELVIVAHQAVHSDFVTGYKCLVEAKQKADKLAQANAAPADPATLTAATDTNDDTDTAAAVTDDEFATKLAAIEAYVDSFESDDDGVLVDSDE